MTHYHVIADEWWPIPQLNIGSSTHYQTVDLTDDELIRVRSAETEFNAVIKLISDRIPGGWNNSDGWVLINDEPDDGTDGRTRGTP